MGLFDVHAHLTSPQMVPHEAAVLAAAEAAGVTTIITNGLNRRDNIAVQELARRSDLVQPAFGLYPVDAVMEGMVALGVDYHRDEDVRPAAETVDWVASHVDECVAVGEVGLDHYWVPEPLWHEQEVIFRQMVRIALDADKPLIVHSRKAERLMLDVLVDESAERVCWHCFGSKVKLGLRIADQGHYLSIPANARKSESFTALLRKLPRDKVLLETDSPYLAPVRGEQNEPANVAKTAEYAAELWGCSLDEVVAQCEANFESLFGFSP